MQWRRAALVVLFAALAAASRAAAPLATVPALIGGERFTLEVAVDAREQFRGLGGRSRVDPHGGMLFVYPSSRPMAFVMRDCQVPIDVAFLDPEGRIINVHEMKAEPARGPGEGAIDYERRLPTYPSALPARYALEVAGGRLRALGVHPGDKVEIDFAALPTLR